MTSAPDLEQLYAYPDDLERPWMRTDFVSTVDGAAWTRDGTSGDLGGSVDKAAFSMMRDLADVIVVGAGTARIEGYRALTEKSVDQGVRARHGLTPIPALVVVSRGLDIPAALIDGGAVVLTSAATAAKRSAAASSPVSAKARRRLRRTSASASCAWRAATFSATFGVSTSREAKASTSM